jgi:PREDICTED: similar to slc6a5 protein
VQQKRLIFTVVIGVFCFLIGLPCVTRGGQYIIEIMDQYGAGLPLVYIAVAECIAVMWIYGFKNFAFDILYMLNRPLGSYWKFTWIWTSPLVLAFIAFYSLVNREPLKLGNYEFPWWVSILGSTITGLILIQIPVWACYAILKQKKADTLIEVCY